MNPISPSDLKRLFKNASRTTIKLNQAGGEASAAVAQHRSRPSSHADSAPKASHPRKRLVRITCFRSRHLQDPDNTIFKWHIDALRRSGLLDDDTAQAIRLQVEPEVKVDTVEEERVEIEIQRL